MRSQQQQNYKHNGLFDHSEDESTGFREKIQNCSVLELDLDQHSLAESEDRVTGHPDLRVGTLNPTRPAPKNHNITRQTLTKTPQLNLKLLPSRNKEITNKDFLRTEVMSPVTNRSQRKRLLEEMAERLEDLSLKKRTTNRCQTEDPTVRIISKMNNVNDLLVEVEHDLVWQQKQPKFSLGMKLKMKVDPTNKYFAHKDTSPSAFRDTSPYSYKDISPHPHNLTSPSPHPDKRHQQEYKEYTTLQTKPISTPMHKLRQYQQPEHHLREDKLPRDTLGKYNKKQYFLKQLTQLKATESVDPFERRYTTENISSQSLTSRRPPILKDSIKPPSRPHLDYFPHTFRSRREEIVSKEMDRRARLYNCLLHEH